MRANEANSLLLRQENKCRLPAVWKRRPKRVRRFNVESIRAHRPYAYLVRWEGYDASHDTWESARRLRADGVGHMIERYHRLEALIWVCQQELV